MDVIHYLERRLAFIKRFYDMAKPGFDANLTRANQKWIDWYANLTDEQAECAPDPPVQLQNECEEADALLCLLGQTCLGALQQTLKECLDAVVLRSGQGRAFKKQFSKLKGSWLQRYRDLFREFLDCDWEKGPVKFSHLEEIVLAWNALKHQGDIASLHRWQDQGFARKFPESRYLGEGDKELDDRPVEEKRVRARPKRVVVTEENLRLATESVEEFLRWVEGESR